MISSDSLFDTLGVDWGEKRTGLALGDSLTSLVIPHQSSVFTVDLETLIEKLFTKYGIKKIVVGYPTNSRGGTTRVTDLIQVFVDGLVTPQGVMVVFQDERYSTLSSSKSLIRPTKLSTSSFKNEYSHSLNHISAVSILTCYFEALQNQN